MSYSASHASLIHRRFLPVNGLHMYSGRHHFNHCHCWRLADWRRRRRRTRNWNEWRKPWTRATRCATFLEWFGLIWILGVDPGTSCVSECWCCRPFNGCSDPQNASPSLKHCWGEAADPWWGPASPCVGIHGCAQVSGDAATGECNQQTAILWFTKNTVIINHPRVCVSLSLKIRQNETASMVLFFVACLPLSLWVFYTVRL